MYAIAEIIEPIMPVYSRTFFTLAFIIIIPHFLPIRHNQNVIKDKGDDIKANHPDQR